ncbi:unnamed protein product [Parajaminaea phylloscopi]
MAMERTWSADSAASPLLDKPSYLASFDASRPRPHRRRSSLPVTASSSLAGQQPPGAEVRERRRFRENHHHRGQASHQSRLSVVGEGSGQRRRPSRPASWAKGDADAPPPSPAPHQTSASRRHHPPRDPLASSIDTSYSSTYAAGPSGSEDRSLSSDSDTQSASTSDGLALRWDRKDRRRSFQVVSRTLKTYLQSSSVESQASTSTHSREPSPRGLALNAQLGSEGRHPPQKQDDDAQRRSLGAASGSAMGPRASRGTNVAQGDHAASPAHAIASASQASAKHTTDQPQRPKYRRGFNSLAETALLLVSGAWACYKLGSRPEAEAKEKAGELALVVISGLAYILVSRSPGMIWSTDKRSYRACDDDGALNGLLMGPLLAVTMLLSSLDESVGVPVRSRSPNQEALPNPPWFVERPIAVLGERNRKAFVAQTNLSALALSRCTLVSLQTVISLIFLTHLITTSWSHAIQTRASRSGWGRFSTYVGFSSLVTALLFLMREGFDLMGLPIWSGLARWEIITASISFQTNMYTISRLGRGSFTLGELGIVAALGVTLMIETINLTLAKLFPNSTLFLKTFRRATPLLIFQLALIVGTFFIGFLLSPLLYLSRHLAQKPVHRLRWPHKRDLHRRLLAGFFYLFAVAYIAGALGLWVRWLLGGRDPWIWTAYFVVSGQRWWTRPALIAHWVLCITASIAGWQAVVSRAKRFRSRNTAPGTTSHKGNVPVKGSQASASVRGSHGTGWGLAPGRASMIAHNRGGNAMNEALHSKVKKASHLSLNARRKFFHALAVVLYTPAIALDPALAHLAFSLAFSVFTFAEYIRYYALYPFGAPLHIFLSEFTDHKDSGPVILSHFYLLTGCGGGLWLEGQKQISLHTGVLILGIGDALASIIGRRYGRLHWPRSSKTMEGSAAFFISVIAAAWLLRLTGWCDHFSLWRYTGAVAFLCLLEGVSEQNDNLILPIFAFISLGLFDV